MPNNLEEHLLVDLHELLVPLSMSVVFFRLSLSSSPDCWASLR